MNPQVEGSNPSVPATITKEHWLISQLGDLFKRNQVADPDKGREEYDVWVESECGRSSLTVTIRGKKVEGAIFFGQWAGKMCALTCIKIAYQRVGTLNVCRTPLNVRPEEEYEMWLPGHDIYIGPLWLP